MDGLPIEIWTNIFDYFDKEVKEIASLVSKSWLKFVRSGPKPFGNVKIPTNVTEININDFLSRWLAIEYLHIKFPDDEGSISDKEKEQFLQDVDFEQCQFLKGVFICGTFFQDLNELKKVGQRSLAFQLKYIPKTYSECEIVSWQNVHQVQIYYTAISSAYAFKKAIELLVNANMKNFCELEIFKGNNTSKYLDNTTILVITEVLLSHYYFQLKKLTCDFSVQGLDFARLFTFSFTPQKLYNLEYLKVFHLKSKIQSQLEGYLSRHEKITTIHLCSFVYPITHQLSVHWRFKNINELILEHGTNFNQESLSLITSVYRNLKNCYIMTWEDNKKEWSAEILKRIIERHFSPETNVKVIIGDRLEVCRKPFKSVEVLKDEQETDDENWDDVSDFDGDADEADEKMLEILQRQK